MELWKDILLILSVLAVFVFGYFWVTRLDRFLNENRRTIEKENEKREPSCVMLTEDMSDEDIAEEVRKFREKHSCVRIILYDSASTKLSESIGCHIEQKL